MPIIDNPLFLAAFAAIALITAILLALFKRRHDRYQLKALSAYAVTAEAAPAGFAQTINRNGYYTGVFFGHLLLTAVISALCVGGFILMLPQGADVQLSPGDNSYAFMFAIWLGSVMLCGLTWHALFGVLREQRLYISGKGKDKKAPEIYLSGGDLYASIALTDGIARDLLVLNGKPFLKVPLAQVTTCKIAGKHIIFTLPEQQKGLALLRPALGACEKELVETIGKTLPAPISLQAA